ncbi:hypothetical protein HNP84_004109 [Thermocatellispora tengchongensis]|uniref:Uncharacterized protein n=1 Tax=Thermocatellispora tengchongensis TaxID=1073253 RepID=A0A840PB10_9ACTN|nr:hypothetical protein [Thermocatellispora tengchongensis]MBB5134377.1 hypothetical protein [Thermocatellispora tengchongensis]
MRYRRIEVMSGALLALSAATLAFVVAIGPPLLGGGAGPPTGDGVAAAAKTDRTGTGPDGTLGTAVDAGQGFEQPPGTGQDPRAAHIPGQGQGTGQIPGTTGSPGTGPPAGNALGRSGPAPIGMAVIERPGYGAVLPTCAKALGTAVLPDLGRLWLVTRSPHGHHYFVDEITVERWKKRVVIGGESGEGAGRHFAIEVYWVPSGTPSPSTPDHAITLPQGARLHDSVLVTKDPERPTC